jgi:hypothetical protein
MIKVFVPPPSKPVKMPEEEFANADPPVNEDGPEIPKILCEESGPVQIRARGPLTPP